jgi:hypothetical protein
MLRIISHMLASTKIVNRPASQIHLSVNAVSKPLFHPKNNMSFLAPVLPFLTAWTSDEPQ